MNCGLPVLDLLCMLMLTSHTHTTAHAQHTLIHTQSLRQIELQDLTTHLDIFEDHRENDFEEILHRFQDIRMEFKYPPNPLS